VIVIKERSMNELFAAVCRAVSEVGRPVAPRGIATREILGAHLCLTVPRRRFLDVPPARVLNPAFAVAEALWVLSGSGDPWIYQYNRRLADYADDGVLQGAYGPRLRDWRGEVDQLDHVRQLLGRDSDTRQAVIQLFDPQRDWQGHRDVPCTLGYRFFIRDGALHMHTTMRSQDVWLGLPYDIFTTTLLQELLAGWLGVEMGEYHHHIDSLHLYETDLPAAAQVGQPAPSPVMPAVAVGWTQFDDLLGSVLADRPFPGASATWSQWGRILASYRAWSVGDRDTARSIASVVPGDMAAALRRWYDHLADRRARTGAGEPAVASR
jgi:thymidylate synthase